MYSYYSVVFILSLRSKEPPLLNLIISQYFSFCIIVFINILHQLQIYPTCCCCHIDNKWSSLHWKCFLPNLIVVSLNCWWIFHIPLKTQLNSFIIQHKIQVPLPPPPPPPMPTTLTIHYYDDYYYGKIVPTMNKSWKSENFTFNEAKKDDDLTLEQHSIWNLH